MIFYIDKESCRCTYSSRWKDHSWWSWAGLGAELDPTVSVLTGKSICAMLLTQERYAIAAKLLRRRGDEEDEPSPVLIVLNYAANVGSFQWSNSWWLRHPRCRLPLTRQQARFRLSSKPFCCLVQLLILQNLVSHNQIKWIGLWVQPEADGVACSWCLWGGCGEMYGRLFIRNQWSMKPVTCCCCWLLLWVLLADIVY